MQRLLRHARNLIVAGTLTGGLVATGVVALTLPSAEAASCARSGYVKQRPLLKQGQRNSAVTYVQCRLGVTPRSGYFGTRTKRAVVRFQRSHGVTASGTVGARTWRALERGTTHASRSVRSGASIRAHVVEKAASLKGRPYRYGATGPDSFDCSGYTRYAYRHGGGTYLPRTSKEQYRKARRISRAAAQPGDLVFFHGRAGVYHVGVYAGGNRLWHAPRTGRTVSKDTIWSKRVTFGRV